MAEKSVQKRVLHSIVIYSALGILAIGLTVSLVSIIPLYSRLKEGLENNLSHAVKVRTMAVDEYLSRAKDITLQITSRTQIRKKLESYNRGEVKLNDLVEYTHGKLVDAMKLSEEVVGISRFGPSGELLVEVGLPLPGWKISPIPPDSSKNVIIHGPISIEKESYFLVGAHIFGGKPTQAGTDIVLFKIDRLQRIVEDYTGLGETGETILGIATDDQIQLFFPLRNKLDNAAKTIPIDSPIGIVIKKSIQQETGNIILKDSTANQIIIAYTPVQGAKWGIAVKMDTAELHSPVNRQIIFILSIIVVLILLGTLGIVLLLRPLTDALQKELAERKQAEEVLKAHSRQQEVIAKLGQQALMDVDLDALMVEAVTLTSQTLGVEYCKVLELLPDGRALLLSAGVGWKEGIVGHATVGVDTDSQAGYTLLSSKPVIVEDLRTETRFSGPPLLHDHSVISGISVIIGDLKQPFGVLGAHTTTRRTFTKGDIHFIQSVANVLADSIERKREEAEKQKLQSQLLQSQKIESIGRLAGGVAHDFNNLLSAILGYSEMAMEEIPEDHPVRKYIRIIIEASEKATAITLQLMAFSRKQVLTKKLVNLNTIVENMDKMLTVMIGEDVILELNTSTPVRNMMADPSQIEQIVMNLVVNARDAMACGGRLTIETADADLDEEYARSHEGARPGSYVMLSVTDTGEGMSRSVQEKVFEPFFTTKELGKGTGLGLSTVYGIVKQHDGYIWLYSEHNKGTTFKIYLPTAEGEVEETDKKERITAARGTETVLVVDDEPSILKLIVDILQPLGYQILKASCGEEALQVSNTFKGGIDILLTDVIMPGMNGQTLADLLKTKRPVTKVIFMSGYTNNVIADYDVRKPDVAFIQKPITRGKLANKLRKVLDGE